MLLMILSVCVHRLMFYVYLSLMVYIIFFKSFASVAAITRLRLVSAWVQHNLLAAVFHALYIHAL